MAAKLTPLPLLFRAAALSRQIAFIIKWNPRSTPVEAIAAQRVQDANTMWCHLRKEKRMCMWTQPPTLERVGTDANPARRVLRLIDLYKDHATHEQFHSEFKTDMDLERLPSGKFDTNFLVCTLAGVAMNILRLMGQNALLGKDAPLRHAAKRRRMIKHAGRWVLGLGANDSAHTVFERLYREPTPARKTSTA